MASPRQQRQSGHREGNRDLHIAAGVCPAVVSLIGSAQSGAKDGYSFAMEMMPMALLRRSRAGRCLTSARKGRQKNSSRSIAVGMVAVESRYGDARELKIMESVIASHA